MFDVKVDRSEDVALHDQVAGEIRRAIAAGEASPGERLPPAKDLAAVLGVNSNTVLRALRILRDEGLLDFRRGRGVTVAGTVHEGAVMTMVPLPFVAAAATFTVGDDEMATADPLPAA